MRKLIYTFWGISMFFIFSCTSDQKPKENLNKIDLLSADDTVKSSSNITYKFPSPIETFLYIKDNKGIFNPELINPVSNLDYYFSSTVKALNFGIYSSDMAYVAIYGDYEKTIELFRASKNLSEELGIHGGFSQEVANRIDRNLYNIDSLYKLTSDSYWEACRYLEEEGMLEFLAPILCGGFIETSYILGYSVVNFENSDPLFKRFSEQGIILENIIEYLESMNQEEYKDLLKYLSKLQGIYEDFYEQREEGKLTKNEFEKILLELSKVRNKIVAI